MTIIFFPDYTSANPYQANLADALDEDVVFGDRGRFFPILRAVRSTDDVSAIHFHWFHPYLFADSRLKTGIQLALTISQLLVVRLLGIPTVWTVHSVISHESRYPWVERWFKHVFVRFGFCCGIFVHCEAVRDGIIDEYDLPEEVRGMVTVIPHGHYIDNYENEVSREVARAELGLDTDATVFLYFGQLRTYKGVPDLIDAFGATDEPEYRLLVVGTPRDEALERTVRERAADDDRIRTVLEFVPDEEIQLYMNACDCVVLPYRRITTSGGAVLAMSFGRAVIISRLGCTPELLDEEGALMYTPGGDPGLRNAIVEARDRDLDSMGAHNERRVRGYSWGDIAETTACVYARSRS